MKKLISLNVKTINQLIDRLSSLPADVRNMQFAGVASVSPTESLAVAIEDSEVEFTTYASFTEPTDYKNETELTLSVTNNLVAVHSVVSTSIVESLCYRITSLQQLAVRQQAHLVMLQSCSALDMIADTEISNKTVH